MKNFFNKLFQWRFIFLQTFIIALSFYCIFYTEAFHEMLSPKKYWESKIVDLKKKIAVDQVKIYSLKNLIDREKATCPYLIKEATLQAYFKQEDVQSYIVNCQKQHHQKIELLRKDLELQKQICHDKQKQLKVAEEKFLQA